MRFRTLLAATAVAAVLAAPAVAATIKPVVNIVTDKANDLRGVAFTSNGKIVVSGHAGTETDTRTVVARFNADGTPDATFGKAGFAEVDLMPGRSEQSLGVARHGQRRRRRRGECSGCRWRYVGLPAALR